MRRLRCPRSRGVLPADSTVLLLCSNIWAIGKARIQLFWGQSCQISCGRSNFPSSSKTQSPPSPRHTPPRSGFPQAASFFRDSPDTFWKARLKSTRCRTQVCPKVWWGRSREIERETELRWPVLRRAGIRLRSFDACAGVIRESQWVFFWRPASWVVWAIRGVSISPAAVWFLSLNFAISGCFFALDFYLDFRSIRLQAESER